MAGFVAELSETMRRGLERGLLEAEEIESLLHAPDFDAAAFDLFLAEARERGVHFPEAAAASSDGEAPPAVDHTISDIERRYLAEIQRYPLLQRENEAELWASMRRGDENARKSLILAAWPR